VTSVSSDREKGFFSTLIFICAIATALPLFVTRYLPITDLPEHIAAIATLRHWFDPAWNVEGTYALSLGKTEYLFYHAVGALLAVPLGDAENASRVLLALVAIAFPYSARALLRARGGDERLSILACTAFWSRPLRIGFVPYVASVPCVLFLLALLSRQLVAPTRKRMIMLVLGSMALFYVHVSGFVLFASISVALVALDGDAPFSTRRSFVEIPKQLLWLAPASLIAIAWMVHGDGPISNGTPNIWYMPERDRLYDFPLWAHDIWTSHLDDLCGILTWAAIAFIALASRAVHETRRQRLAAWAPFLVTSVLYAALPTQVGAAASVNERLALFFPLFLLLVLRPRFDALGKFPIAVAAFSVFATAGIAAREVHAASHDELGNFDPLLAHIRPNAKLVSLIFHPKSAHVAFGPWYQMGSYHRAESGGVASFSFSEIAHWPIHYLPEAAPPPHHAFWEFDPCVYRNAVDGSYYDYVLTRGAVDPFRDDPPGPKWKKIATEKDWTLFEKISNETNSEWIVEDRGPCESRWSLERATK
jgi:hypothetical protein